MNILLCKCMFEQGLRQETFSVRRGVGVKTAVFCFCFTGVFFVLWPLLMNVLVPRFPRVTVALYIVYIHTCISLTKRCYSFLVFVVRIHRVVLSVCRRV